MSDVQIHGHYFRDVSGLQKIDIYRLLELFDVTCPVAQHIIKKAMAAGKRGAKDKTKDMREVADSAARWLEMREEDTGRESFREAIDSIFGRLKVRVEPVQAAAAEVAATVVPVPVEAANLDAFTPPPALPVAPPAAEPDQAFDEARIDMIARNGNDGEHYDAIERRETRQIQQLVEKQTAPLAQPRRADPIKPKSEAHQLPDTSGLVDPSGKPSWDNAPIWAMWLTQNAAGVWMFWRHKPYIIGRNWVRSRGDHQEFNSGDVVGNWRQSLEEAPGRLETKSA